MLHAFASLVLGASVLGMLYAIVALARIVWFGRRLGEFERSRASGADSQSLEHAPPVTIFKPLAGVEPGLRENLRSFCAQDYPQFQVVFGVRDSADPGAEVVRAVIEEFRDADVTLVVGANPTIPNAKVATLVEMANAAKHDLFIIADSDTRVAPDYLRAVVAPFADSEVGAVTCVYRGQPGSGVPSDLGAMMIDDQFIPSVLVAALGRIRFCLGATMAVRRQTLAAIGGFAALGPYLADDQRLGELVAATGTNVAFAPYVVEHDVNEPSIGALWDHEVRWARTSRLARPLGYAGYGITYPLPLALLFVALTQNVIIGGIAALVALALRLGIHYASRAALRSRSPDKPWLIPVRDGFGFAVWVVSLFGGHVRWRDRVLVVDSRGRIVSSSR